MWHSCPLIALETKQTKFSVENLKQKKPYVELWMRFQTIQNGASSICLQRVPSVIFGCLKMKLMFLIPGSVPTSNIFQDEGET